jgi:pyruvate/2-oxoglutarate dehydrogenase complex dihydrolipoamide dehydrogenase (E3) component
VDGKQTLHCKNILVATGSRSKDIGGFQVDEKRVLSSTGLLMLEKLPKSILILGGGAIGVEFAYVMNAFGVEVHLVEMMPQLLPLEDAEVVAILIQLAAALLVVRMPAVVIRAVAIPVAETRAVAIPVAETRAVAILAAETARWM